MSVSLTMWDRGFRLELQIEKLVYGGDGLARLPADDRGRGKTVFLPFVIPGERVEATVTENRSGFARAQLDTGRERRLRTVSRRHVRILADAEAASISTSITQRNCDSRPRSCVRHCGGRPSSSLNSEIQLHRIGAVALSQSHARPHPTCSRICVGLLRNSSHELLAVESCPNQFAAHQPGHRRRMGSWDAPAQVPTVVHGMQFFANHDDTAVAGRDLRSRRRTAAEVVQDLRGGTDIAAGFRRWDGGLRHLAGRRRDPPVRAAEFRA